MNEKIRLSYTELCEFLEGDVGKQIRQLALQSRVIARTQHSEFRGDFVTPGGLSEMIAMVAVQDFLDLCFDHNRMNQD